MDLGMFAVLGVANLSIDPAVVASWTHLWWVCMVLTVAVAIAMGFVFSRVRTLKGRIICPA
ncbi:MAG: hypothetical protein RR218_09470 [Gordonibacter sp.]